MLSVRLIWLLLLLAGLSLLPIRAEENVARARGNVPVNPLRQRELDPMLRPAIVKAAKAEYITPDQHQGQIIQVLEKTTEKTLKEHKAFVEEHECGPEIFQMFSRQIQPILFNSCAAGACHGAEKAGAFAIHRPRYVAQTTAVLTRQNFSNTLSLIYKNQPESSPLLIQALTPHGGASHPPLHRPDSAAYQTLKAWVMRTAVPTSQTDPPITPLHQGAHAGFSLSESEEITEAELRTVPERGSLPLPAPSVRQVPIRRVQQEVLDSGMKPETLSKDAQKKNGGPLSTFRRFFNGNR